MKVTGGTVGIVRTSPSADRVDLLGNFTFAGVANNNDKLYFQNGYSSFRVVGNVVWTGGKFTPGVDGASGHLGDSDKWIATREFTVGNSIGENKLLQPVIQSQPTAIEHPTWKWQLLVGQRGIIGILPALPDNLSAFALEAIGTGPGKGWFVHAN